MFGHILGFALQCTGTIESAWVGKVNCARKKAGEAYFVHGTKREQGTDGDFQSTPMCCPFLKMDFKVAMQSIVTGDLQVPRQGREADGGKHTQRERSCPVFCQPPERCSLALV